MREKIMPRFAAYLSIMLVGAALGSSSAEAQIGVQGEGFARDFRPDFLRRDLQLINDRLKLGQEQQEIVQTVLHDYIETFDVTARQALADLSAAMPVQERVGLEIQARQEQLQQEMEVLLEQLQQAVTSGATPEQIAAMRAQVQARIESVQSEIDQIARQAANTQRPEMTRVAEGLSDRLNRWRQQRTALRDALTTDTALILDEDQRKLWDSILLEIRRQRLLPEGELAGESVDLFNLLRQTGLSGGSTADLDELLAEYAANLDTALADRERILDELTVPLWLAIRSGDHLAAADARSQAVAARVAVRDLHMNTAKRLGESLGDEHAATLDQALRRQAFAAIVTPSIGTRLLEEATSASDIAIERKQLLAERSDVHQAQWNQQESDFQEVILSQQPVALIARPEAAGGASAAARAEQLMSQASDALRHLDVETIEQVFGILGETRFMELAAAPAATSFLVAMRDRAEQGGLRAADRRAIRARLDRNGDGLITADEIRAAQGGG